MNISGVIAVLAAVSACSGTTSTTSDSSVSLTVQSASSTSSASTSTSVRPTRWTIAINVAVTSPEGKAPFDLQVDSPVVLSDLAQPTTLSMRATATDPVLVIFRAEVLTARLQGAGTLDVVGPGCPATYNFAESPGCSADPVSLTIGDTSSDVTAPKPTGSVIPSNAIPVVLITEGLRSGMYHLVASGVWQPNEQGRYALRPFDITIDFTVTGPS